MSKKFKSQASSARAASGFGGFGAFQTEASPLSYISEQPDVSSVNDPNIVVALKNIGKKDSVTKQKGLDELLDDKNATSYKDFAVLTAWSDLYARASIDNSTAVRRNAHSLQGKLTTTAGKIIVPLLPKVVPSWLAGTFDSDKTVAKAANDALEQSFPTPEKRQALWKLYKDAISDRVEDSLLKQTPGTLSDERHTSPDEASIKYARVIGMCCRLLAHQISLDTTSDVLYEKELWDLVNHEDGYVRSSICMLLIAILQKKDLVEQLDWTVLSTAFLYKGLQRSQIGSMRAFLTALTELSKANRSVWTELYTAKTPVSKRLNHFLRQGSQNGPEDTWTLLANLIILIPIDAHKSNNADASTLIESLRVGVLKERLYIDAAWQAYLTWAEFLCKTVSPQDQRDAFIEQHISPLVMSFLKRSTDEHWKIGGRAERTALKALQWVETRALQSPARLWEEMASDTLSRIKLSLPESSKDFRISQDGVIAQGKRFQQLRQATHPRIDATKQVVNSATLELLHGALDIFKSRNGKSYGAAAIISDLVADFPNDEQLQHFLTHDLERFLSGPSSQQLVTLALATETPVATSLLNVQSPTPDMIKSIQYMLQRASKQDLSQNSNGILQKIGHFENDERKSYFAAILANENAQDTQLRSDLLSRLLADLKDSEQTTRALAALEIVAASPAILKVITSSEQGQDISSRLLLLADSSDQAVADQAVAVVAALNAQTSTSTSSLPIIRQQLAGNGELISILSLTDLGLKYKETSSAFEMLPTAEDWSKALEPHLNKPPPSSLTITSPLHGVVWSINGNDSASNAVVRDTEQFSQLFRITFFVTQILDKDYLLEVGVSEDIRALAECYPLALQLINDKLTLDDANGLWLGSTEEVVNAAADILSDGLQMIRNWHANESFASLWLSKLEVGLENVSPRSYYEALVCTKLLGQSLDQNPREIMQTFEEKLSKLHKSSQLLPTSSLLAAAAEYLLGSQAGLKIVNELIAQITSDPVSNNTANLTYLNILLRNDNSILEKVPQQRLVFLLQKMVNFVRESADGMNQLAEGFVLLSSIIPFVQDMFGDYWESLLTALDDSWKFVASDDISLIQSSLLVYAQLQRAARSDDVNDDLIEVLAAKSSDIASGLTQCLRALSDSKSEIDQPRGICAELLRRQLRTVEISDHTQFYPLLQSNLSTVRSAAYDALHRSIPEKQAQLSIDLVLEGKVMHLPQELLELIEDKSPSESYMLCWKLAFDHYPNASHKLQLMYTDSLKASGLVPELLVFLCEKLGITSGRPLVATKVDATQFEHDQSELDNYTIQHLGVHLYFMALTHISGLVKDWLLNQKNSIKTPLKTWTQRYITPLIVTTSLQAVTDWAETQDKNDQPIEVKTSTNAAEVVASIKIDPESPPAALSITLPAAYPLDSPVVTERTRVGVSERAFVSWIRTIQIIIFSSGSIVEGLVAFRRNVQGALKGQTECAICYSVIGTDMQTPNKKCGTCKNMFHGVCLYKWFRSSSSSSCPLCRNNFNYA